MIQKVLFKETIAMMLLGTLVLAGSPAMAGTERMDGSTTQATPFDNKISRSGALESLSRVPETTSADQLFLTARSFRYKKDDATSDLWQTPQETEQRWAGDCEDKAVWLYANLKQNGYQDVRLVIGRFRAGLHVWVTMPDGQGGYFILDPTAHKRIWNASDFPENLYRPLYSFDGLERYRHDV